MDKKTAEILLNVNQYDSAIDAYEDQLFKIRNYVFMHPVVPSVYRSKQRKVSQISEAIAHFGITEEEPTSIKLSPILGEHLFDKFICYESNRSKIKRFLSQELSAKSIETGINLLIENLLEWNAQLTDIDTSSADPVPLSKELDVLKAHQLLKKHKNKESRFFDAQLISEFKRIQTLSASIES
tara:strand:+ start:395 stop:943 length:549 start_codon:yes stop_codon:yes gene_type:complete